MATLVDILLLEDVQGLGRFGQRKKVKLGYARNFLVPKKLAFVATVQNLKKFEEIKLKQESKRQEILEKAQAEAAHIGTLLLDFQEKTHDNGKLYGSIGVTELTLAFKQQHNVDVEKRHVLLVEPIKSVGEYSVALSLHVDVRTSVKVVVQSSDR